MNLSNTIAEKPLRVAELKQAVERRDPTIGSHMQRIGPMSAFLAAALGMSLTAVRLIRIAAPMHDVGKIGLPDSILRKPGPLTPSQRTEMQCHPQVGYDLLSGSDSPEVEMGATIALTHHERWDGSGYPNGLAGTEIPIEGRIVAVADVFDALVSDRVYHERISVARAAQVIKAGSGTHFDPEIVGVFLRDLPEILRSRDPDEEWADLWADHQVLATQAERA
jgi:putative two-component system response regulator